jgi:hypothetical protein
VCLSAFNDALSTLKIEGMEKNNENVGVLQEMRKMILRELNSLCFSFSINKRD